MATLAESDRYSRGAIAFHWAIALLVIVNLAIGLFHDGMPRGWGVMPLHKAIGITVLVLTLGRVAWRLGHRPPPLPATIPPWERATARAAHWLLYGFLVAMPLSGWMMVSGAEQRRPLDWFGLFPIPYLPVGTGAGEAGHTAHEVLGYAMAVLAVIHILAALRHHLLLRDATLVRMLPILRVPSR